MTHNIDANYNLLMIMGIMNSSILALKWIETYQENWNSDNYPNTINLILETSGK
ncbi:MAG: hypothetical protein O2951_19185 [Bacteroidetes bacterium]|nr:hypothetical protein [Bacteroidota bacterium]